jgi:hypothetical protein
MTAAHVDNLLEEYSTLRQLLLDGGEPSLAAAIERVYPKVMVVAVASYFEDAVTNSIAEFCRESVTESSIHEFVRNKGLSRQYHTLFNWNSKNLNTFYGLFGEDAKYRHKKWVQECEANADAVLAFLEIGSLRNTLVHQDFADFALEKTALDVHHLYNRAMPFVESVTAPLRGSSALTPI